MKLDFITGSSGFIGSRLKNRLGRGVLSIHGGSVTDYLLIPFGRFFFLSSYGNLAGQKDWHGTVKSNVIDPVFVLAYHLLHPGGKFLFVSTSSVNLPFNTPYSLCKRAAELVILSANDPNTFIVRPYSVTGVGEQSCHLIPKLIHSCYTGETIPFFPDAIHDFVDVEDLVDGLILISEQKTGGIFELGTGKPTSNAKVKRLVEEITGRKANTTPCVGRPYDTKDWYCRDMAASFIGWNPKKNLRQSIEEMVEAYEQSRKPLH